MGKRSLEDVIATARANNYNFGVRSEQEVAQSQKIYNYTSKTMRDQNGYLSLYEIWRNEFAHDAPTLSKGSPAPTNELLNDFIRFHAKASKGQGRIDKERRITADSCLSFMEGFYAGFQRRTGTIISEEERQPVYTYIKTLLWEEGHVVNMKRRKMLFQKADFDRFNDTFWTADLDIFVHPRNLAQYPFLLSVYTWTGARIGAFFASKDNPDGGLRYKDIELVIERTPFGEWVVFYQINQIWIKNNRNPNVHFGSTTGQHSKLTYDDTHHLLVMAVADKALYGVETLYDLRKMKIPVGEQNMILPWKESHKNLPILRQATMEQGVTEKPWAKSSFEKIFRTVAKQSGYIEAPTVHAIRRAVGKMIDERYTSVQRSQHLTQKDLSVFGNSYVANTSSVDGKSAFLNEPARRDHIDYFQSFERFRENGLPTTLPAHLERAVMHDPQLTVLKNDLLMLKKDCASSSQLKTARNKINSYLYMIRQKALVQYQEDWVQQQRQSKVRLHGHLAPHKASKTDLLDTMSLIFPGRDRLAQVMIARNDVSENIRWQTMQDLHDLITKDYSTIYLPGEEPINERCSFKKCAFNLSRLPKDQRSTHAHACHRKRMAVDLQRNINDIKYCYLCFTWSTEEDWNEHCRLHLSLISSKRCGSIVCCNTLLRPFFCPLCIGDINLDWSSRLKSWTKGDKVRKHIDTHLATAKWPMSCMHPLCYSQYETQESFSDHLKDDHAIPAWFGKSSQQPDPPSKYEFVDCKRLKRKLCDDTLENIEIDHTEPDGGPGILQTIAPRMLMKEPLDNFNTLAIKHPSVPGYEEMQQDQVRNDEKSQAEDDALFSSYTNADYYETIAAQLSKNTQDGDGANGLIRDASVLDAGNGLSSEIERHQAKTTKPPSPAKKPRIILRVKPSSKALEENQVAGRKRLKTARKSAESKTSMPKARPLSCKARPASSKSTIPKIRLRL